MRVGVPQGLTYEDWYESPLFKDAFAEQYRENKDVSQEWADSHKAVYVPWDACCVEHLDNPPDSTPPGEFFARGERVLARYAPYTASAISEAGASATENPSGEENKDGGDEGATTEDDGAGRWFLATVVRARGGHYDIHYDHGFVGMDWRPHCKRAAKSMP